MNVRMVPEVMLIRTCPMADGSCLRGECTYCRKGTSAIGHRWRTEDQLEAWAVRQGIQSAYSRGFDCRWRHHETRWEGR